MIILVDTCTMVQSLVNCQDIGRWSSILTVRFFFVHFKFKDSHCMGWHLHDCWFCLHIWIPLRFDMFWPVAKKKKKTVAPLKPDLDPLRILPVFEGGVMWYPKSYWESRYDPDTKYCCLHPGFLFVYMALDVYCFTMVTGPHSECWYAWMCSSVSLYLNIQ